nr:MAG TPA: putative transcriptional regulator [Caudoviricetes sp.]
MENFIERLQYYMKTKGINDNQMTIAASLSVGLIGKAKVSGKGMSSMNVEKILLAYPDLNSDWLLTGRGAMLKDDNSSLADLMRTDPEKCINHTPPTSPSGNISDKPVATPAISPNEGIPLIPIEAMAGALTSEQTILEYECERYVIPIFKGADFLIPVKGSSMYPKYSSGDIVACQRVPMSDLFFQWNKVYVIDTIQGPLIKRIKPGSDKEHISIISDNSNYDPFELHRSAIHAVALVIGVIRLE